MSLTKFFDARLKVWDHVVQFLLVIIAIALTGAHLNLGVIYGRAEIMTIAMGAKTILVITYQLLTEHVQRFRRWGSPLANLILNNLEVVFWLVVAILKITSMQRFCQGTACSLSIGVVIIAFVLECFNIHVAIISVIEYRHHKRVKGHHVEAVKSSRYQMSTK